MDSKKIEILHADDDIQVIDVTREILRSQWGPAALLYWATDGEQAVELLKGTGKTSPKELHLIVLDLRMPKRHGLEVLREIRAHRRFADVPVVIFSATGIGAEIDLCYRLGANSFIHKPFDPQGLRETVDQVLRYWIELNVSPTAIRQDHLARG